MTKFRVHLFGTDLTNANQQYQEPLLQMKVAKHVRLAMDPLGTGTVVTDQNHFLRGPLNYHRMSFGFQFSVDKITICMTLEETSRNKHKSLSSAVAVTSEEIRF